MFGLCVGQLAGDAGFRACIGVLFGRIGFPRQSIFLVQVGDSFSSFLLATVSSFNDEHFR
jgi:hypothetical protein